MVEFINFVQMFLESLQQITNKKRTKNVRIDTEDWLSLVFSLIIVFIGLSLSFFFKGRSTYHNFKEIYLVILNKNSDYHRLVTTNLYAVCMIENLKFLP